MSRRNEYCLKLHREGSGQIEIISQYVPRYIRDNFVYKKYTGCETRM